MALEFDYTISKEREEKPIGYVEYFFSKEKIEYYSEQELLDNFKDEIYSVGYNAARAKVYSTKDKPRHGLRYAIDVEIDDEYTKEEYEENYKKSQVKKKNKEQGRW